MRILSITAQKADSTGSGVFLTELVKGFQKAGHTQAVICGVAPGEQVCLPQGVRVFPVRYQTDTLPFPVCGMSDEMPYESTRYRELDETMTAQLEQAFTALIRETVTAFRPDVILCHHLYFVTALARSLCPHIPVYGQCHGSDLRQIRKNPWQRERIRQQIARLDGIFALQAEQKEQICRIFALPEEKVMVMGTGYNSDVFFDSGERQPSEKLRLIFAGKLSEKKGVMSLLRALSHVQGKADLELALAGGSGNREELDTIRHLAQSTPYPVTFLGMLSHSRLAWEMNQRDVFVLPSFYEGLPLVVIEALACGLRVVCTDLPGIRPWLDGAVPGHGVLFVAPPRMRNEDEPVPESLPAFEKALASAIEQAPNAPQADMAAVRSVSWDALCEKMIRFWLNHP